MKSIQILAISILCFFLTSNALSQDLNQKINQIKSWYKEIKAMEKKLTVSTNTTETEEGGEFTTKIYKSGAEVKIVGLVSAGPGDCGEAYTIYYRNSVPFFVLYESECFVNNKTTKDVNRYYLDNGKLIQFLKGNAKTNIKVGTEEFKGEEYHIIVDIINDAQKYLK